MARMQYWMAGSTARLLYKVVSTLKLVCQGDSSRPYLSICPFFRSINSIAKPAGLVNRRYGAVYPTLLATYRRQDSGIPPTKVSSDLIIAFMTP